MAERTITVREILDTFPIPEDEYGRFVVTLLAHAPIHPSLSKELTDLSDLLHRLEIMRREHQSEIPHFPSADKYDLAVITKHRDATSSSLTYYIDSLSALRRKIVRGQLGDVELPVTGEEITVAGYKLKRQ